MSPWYVRGITFYAFGMGMFFALSGAYSPEIGRAAIPASIALTSIGLLGGVVSWSLESHALRLRSLEEQVKFLNAKIAERGTS